MFTFYCPEDNNFQLYGSIATPKSKFLAVGIDKCTPQNKLVKDQDCATGDEINEWLSKHNIITMSGYDVIDFSQRGMGHKPVYQKYYLDNMKGLEVDKLVLTNNFLRRNNIETYDSYYNVLGDATYEGDFYAVAKTTDVV